MYLLRNTPLSDFDPSFITKGLKVLYFGNVWMEYEIEHITENGLLFFKDTNASAFTNEVVVPTVDLRPVDPKYYDLIIKHNRFDAEVEYEHTEGNPYIDLIYSLELAFFKAPKIMDMTINLTIFKEGLDGFINDMFDALGEKDVCSASELHPDYITSGDDVYIFDDNDRATLRDTGTVTLIKYGTLEDVIDLDDENDVNFMKWFTGNDEWDGFIN